VGMMTLTLTRGIVDRSFNDRPQAGNALLHRELGADTLPAGPA